MKYKGIFPSFYGCYDSDGAISPARIHALANHFLNWDTDGFYVGGTAGEADFQSLEEKKQVLERVMEACKEKCTVIAQISAFSTEESLILARHAEELGVDALCVAPPPFCSETAIYEYWAEIAKATKRDLLFCHRPLWNGCYLPFSFLERIMKHPRLVGIYSVSSVVSDVLEFKKALGRDRVVLQGVDTQFTPGILMGADGGIGETYGVMPELYLMAYRCMEQGDVSTAKAIQAAINDIICSIQKVPGSLHGALKSILRVQGLDIGPVRPPLEETERLAQDQISEIAEKIHLSIQKFC